MKRNYKVVMTQGQGSIKTKPLTRVEARREYLTLLGNGSIGVLKNEQLLSDKELCQEFDFDPVVLEEYVKLRMRFNSLHKRLVQ